jgi:hypothetical protein
VKPLPRLRRRGAAAVELSLLMIVLIPTLMYTFFLEDLLFYKFDLEETVVSTPWDYTIGDWREKSGQIAGNVQAAAMQTFWDHTSAWNSYEDPNYDAKETVHHEAMAAHQCWLAKGGEEVNCSMQKSVGLSIQGQFIMMNKGGLASCKAKLGVQNYFLANKIFGGYGKYELAGTKASGSANNEMKMHTTGQSQIHAEAKQDPYLYPEMHFGLVVDTWALYKMKTMDTDKHPMEQGQEFAKWVRIPYGTRFQYLDDARKYAQDAVDKEILSNAVLVDGLGDTIETPPVAWKAAPERTFRSHHTSAWDDPKHQQTYNKLEERYMGLPESTW